MSGRALYVVTTPAAGGPRRPLAVGRSFRLEDYPLRWYWRKRHGDRKGHPCRVVARSRPARAPDGSVARRWNTVMVEWPDGFRTITSGHALRKPESCP